MMFLFLRLSLVPLTLIQSACRQIAESVFRSHHVPYLCSVFQSLVPSAASTVKVQKQNLGLPGRTVGQQLLVGRP